MIKSRIKNSVYKDHLGAAKVLSDTVYLVDYSNSAKPKLGTCFLDTIPNDIEVFTINNPNAMDVCCLRYTDKSFQRKVNGIRKFRSQCEGVLFPDESDIEPWIMFSELKYCKVENNKGNINKARRQLYKTRYYYKEQGIISRDNTSYLIISLPKQNVPYAHTAFSQPYLTRLKKKHNVILRATDKVEILDKKNIFVD